MSVGVYKGRDPITGKFADGHNRYEHLKTSSERMRERRWGNAPTIIPAEPSEEQREYEAQVEAAQYCEMYEPSYDPETGAL